MCSNCYSSEGSWGLIIILLSKVVMGLIGFSRSRWVTFFDYSSVGVVAGDPRVEIFVDA